MRIEIKKFEILKVPGSHPHPENQKVKINVDIRTWGSLQNEESHNTSILFDCWKIVDSSSLYNDTHIVTFKVLYYLILEKLLTQFHTISSPS